MSDEMNMQKVIRLLESAKDMFGFNFIKEQYSEAVLFLEKLQAQPKPTGRTVEDVSSFCLHYCPFSDPDWGMDLPSLSLSGERCQAWKPDKQEVSVESAPVEPVKVDDVLVCSHCRGSGKELYTQGDFLPAKCEYCNGSGRKILRKGE